MFGVYETPYDLRFQFLGIPVRVQPFFWVVAAMLGFMPENLPVTAIFVACAFLSILVHEYGHGLVARSFGASPGIVLQAFGGLCIYQPDRQTPGQRLAVLLCGPGAGFVLCGVVMAVFSALFGLTLEEHLGFVEMLFRMPSDLGFGPEKLKYVDDPHAVNARFFTYWFLVQINILWGLINLLPVWPLDGGQVTHTVLSQVNPYNGRRWTHIVSLLVAALVAIISYSLTQQVFRSLFFAYFAIINYQMLDMIHRAQTLGIYEDDWWRK
jgi:stage IV sporulation protein FB